MKIKETFYSIQGEGPEVGTPTFFIRTYGCNMKPECEFCDTKYSLKGKNIDMSTKGLVLKMLESESSHFTFTGGEPTLYDKEIGEIKRWFHSQHFSLETNGLLKTNVDYNKIIVSPKRQNHNLEVLSEYSKMDNTSFKFVYENENDLWWEELIEDINIPKDKVYVMPEGSRKEKQELQEETEEITLEKSSETIAKVNC